MNASAQPDAAQPDAAQLNALQRWMLAVVMHPGGVEAGADSKSAQSCFATPTINLEDVIDRSHALTSAERLAIYNRAYFARLLECLRDSYRVLCQAIGEEAFDDFAVSYLQDFPSNSYTLNDLGARFPDYLRQGRQAADPEETWPDFVVDLATLESLYNEVFDGPGVEGRELMSAELLAGIPPERWSDLHFEPVPCLRLLELRFPVHEYYTAARQGDEADYPSLSETLLVVTRCDFVIRRFEVDRPQFELLKSLVQGDSLGAALSQAAQQVDDVERFASKLKGWFRDWTSERFFIHARC